MCPTPGETELPLELLKEISSRQIRAEGRQDGTRKTIKELPESGKGGGWRVDVVGGSSEGSTKPFRLCCRPGK